MSSRIQSEAKVCLEWHNEKSLAWERLTLRLAKHLPLYLYTSHKQLLLHMVHLSMTPQQRALVDATTVG